MIVQGLILATLLIGFFGVIFKQNLMLKIIAMDVMSTGVIAFYTFIAARSGRFTPIWAATAKSQDYADPVPQAVILTAIVIGLSIQAVMLVGVMKLARDNPTLEISAIEESDS